MGTPTLTQNEKKPWFKSAFDNVSISQPSPKKLRTNSFAKSFSQNDTIKLKQNNIEQLLPQNKLVEPDFYSSNWIENFAPQNITDLAVHQKKIEELQDWFIAIKRSKDTCPGPMLLLTGGSGVGKTETLKLIAKNLNYEINEWINPMDIDLVKYNKYDSEINTTYRENQYEQFENFLFKSSRYSSLFNMDSERIIIVEDFPNIFLKNSTEFTEILSRFTSFGKSPLIFIATDTRSSQLNISYNLFPENVRTQFNINHISFNAISTTLLKKGLKRICQLMSQKGFSQYYKQPTQEILDSIILASQGDIRSAVLNLHFASLKNAPLLSTEEILNTSINNKKTKIKTKNFKLKTIGRNENITLMHALGRVFNPKYTEEKKFLHSPENLTESFITQPKHFVSFIQSNYLKHFNDIEYLANAADCLSNSDILMSEYRDDAIPNYALNIAIRGIMIHNKNPLGGWKPISGLKHIKDTTNILNEQKKYGIEKNSITRDVFILDYRTYAEYININNNKT